MSSSSVALFLTQRCNGNCHYCDIPDIKNPRDLDINLYREFIPLLNKKSVSIRIRFTGGEIGLLSENNLDIIFSEIECRVQINTNGTFIKKNYHEKYRNKIRSIYYHILRDDVVEVKNIPTKYIIVWHNENLEEVNYLYSKYEYLNPTVVVYRSKSIEKDYLRLEKVNIPMTTECTVAPKLIDFVDGFIGDCCESYSFSPRSPLTKEAINTIPDRSERARLFHMCKYCPRVDEEYYLNKRLCTGEKIWE